MFFIDSTDCIFFEETYASGSFIDFLIFYLSLMETPTSFKTLLLASRAVIASSIILRL